LSLGPVQRQCAHRADHLVVRGTENAVEPGGGRARGHVRLSARCAERAAPDRPGGRDVGGKLEKCSVGVGRVRVEYLEAFARWRGLQEDLVDLEELVAQLAVQA